jgi:hypothetical protein
MADPVYIGTPDAELRARRPSGSGGGGSDEFGGLDSRVARLEAFNEVSRDDLREIKSDLKAIISKLGTFPTKLDLESWKWQWMLASVAIFALAVSSIIGGLAWLAPK